jgi:hypothetical protein
MSDMFYVYLYRDNKSSAVKYIGRGAKITRASAHQHKSHNKELESWLRKANFKLEIAGPFDTEDMSKAVEAALISSHSPTFNKRQESSKFIFRPIGVPEKYIARLQKAKLTREDLFKGTTNKILLVRITDQDFKDRVGYNQVSPPGDEAVVDRVQKYWQLGGEKFLEKWIVDKNQSPTLLLGISGSPGSQIIIASLEIDNKQWSNVRVLKNKLISVPLASSSRLDKYGLRGYRLDKSAEIRFGSFRPEQFRIITK